MRYIYFIFPLIILISLKHSSLGKKSKIYILLFLLIVVLSHTSLSWHYGTLSSNPQLYKDLEPSANWFLDHSNKKIALVDLTTGNKYLLESVVKGTYFEKQFYTREQYGLVVNTSYSLTKNGLSETSPYVIINKNINKIQSVKWQNFEPFLNYYYGINNNINIMKVYDDDAVWIFKTT